MCQYFCVKIDKYVYFLRFLTLLVSFCTLLCANYCTFVAVFENFQFNLIILFTMKKILSIFVAMMLCLPMMQGAIKVHTIGDSTMAEYDESTTDKRGWGMYLGSFFDPAFVTVNNRGKSRAGTRGFYTGAAYWPSVKSQMIAGD